MTIEQKINNGLLKREVVTRRLAQFKLALETKTAVWATLEGFERDMYAARNLVDLNREVSTGELILNKMDELRVP